MIHALSEAAMGSISYYAKLAERRTITVEDGEKAGRRPSPQPPLRP